MSLRSGLPIPVAAVTPRIRTGEELVKRECPAQTEDADLGVDKEVAENLLDFAGGVDVFVPHQDAVVELVAGAKGESCGGLPSEAPENCAFAGNPGAKDSVVGEEQAALRHEF